MCVAKYAVPTPGSGRVSSRPTEVDTFREESVAVNSLSVTQLVYLVLSELSP